MPAMFFLQGQPLGFCQISDFRFEPMLNIRRLFRRNFPESGKAGGNRFLRSTLKSILLLLIKVNSARLNNSSLVDIIKQNKGG